MTGMEKGDECSRASERIDREMQIMIYDQEAKTVNISSKGVYLEVITEDLEAFALGLSIPIEINTVASIPGLTERDVRLKGNGLVVRHEVKDITGHGNRLRVALEFKNRLQILKN